ncbi:MAG: hypothetical protein RTV31_00105 [Candidatus Thorarchaeota archaeon]
MSNDDNDNEEIEIPKMKPPKPPRPREHAHADMDELREVAEVLPQLFGALNDSIPKLISGLIGSVYSPEAAGNMAKGIGQFYSNLVAEGIPEEVALEMTKKFVGALDFSKLMSLVTDEASSEEKKLLKKRKKARKEEVDYDDEDGAFDEEFE